MFNQYLPQAEERLARLRYVINKRPVALLLPGTSIFELEQCITELKDADICYATVNDFWIMENKILSPIDKRLDIVLCSAIECHVPSDRHLEYLGRNDENVFITEAVSFHHSCDEIIKGYNRKLLFFVAERGMRKFFVPSPENPLHFWAQASFAILLCMLLIGKPSSIFLFGADGGKLGKDLYYGGWGSDSEIRLSYDTILFNRTFNYMYNMTLRTHGLLPDTPIVNVSANSHYTVFNKMSYNEAIKALGGK